MHCYDYREKHKMETLSNALSAMNYTILTKCPKLHPDTCYLSITKATDNS